MVNWEIKRCKSGVLDIKSLLEVQNAIQYEGQVLSPGIWKAQAKILLRAADKLFQVYDIAETQKTVRIEKQIELSRENSAPVSTNMDEEESEEYLDTLLLPISLLLMGYAIENLLKGIIFSRDPSLLIEDDKNLRLSTDIKGHNLAGLYVKAGLAKSESTINQDTKEILAFLREYLLWRGRYAIPLVLQEFKNRKPIPSCLRYPDKTNLNPEKIATLVEQLSRELDGIPMPPTHMGGDK